MIPSSTDLTYFIEVANFSNLSKAAQKLGITQPSLTLAMSRIENAIGVPILFRHKHGVALTAAGKQLLGQSRLLLDQWELIRAKTLEYVNEVQGSFSIGCHPSVGLYALPLFLTDLMQKNPKLEIRLVHDLSRRITDQVIDLKIDIGIAVNPVKHPDLIIKHLAYDYIALWQAPQKSKKSKASITHDLLFCDPELYQAQAILKQLKKHNINYQRMISSNSLELIAELTKSGGGVGILPGTVAITRQLVKVANSPTYEDEKCLLYRGENQNVKAIQAIANAIKIAFNQPVLNVF